MKLLVILGLFVFQALAQDEGKSLYEVTGFPAPTDDEVDTLYADTYLSLKKSTQCRRDFIEEMRARKQKGSVEQLCAEADKFCRGTGVVDANQRWMEDNFRSFLGTFADASMASNGLDECQSNAFNYYKGAEYQGQKDGMKCWSQGAPGSSYGSLFKSFLSTHHALINADDTSSEKLDKIVKEACKDFEKDNRSTLVQYSAGHEGTFATRTIKSLSSLKEALPLIHFSTVRNSDMGQDFAGSNLGSSDLGADAVAKEIEHDRLQKFYDAYDGNRFQSFFDDKSSNPNFRMRGYREGNDSKWNEKDNPGSATVMFWEMCVVQNEEDANAKVPQDKNKSGPSQKSLSLANENVSIELPDNVVSPFPLKVKEGAIVGAELKSQEKSGFIFPDLNAPAYAYGPRNTDLTAHDKSLMVTAATAMTNKARSFVDSLLETPGESINLEKSSLIVASCSNFLRNQPGYKTWKTDSVPEARSSDDRISFEELSDQRASAQYSVLTGLVGQELKKRKSELEEARARVNAQRLKIPEDSTYATKLANKLSYLDHQISKISKIDLSKLKKQEIDCNIGENKGVGGPNPYYHELKQKYGGTMSWPSFDKSNPSDYFLQVGLISKELKKKDVEEKLSQTKRALKDLDVNDQVKASIFKDWIKKYEKILAEKDGTPSYLSIPLFNITDKGVTELFPCDMNRPSENITCKIADYNSRSLDAFKVEKFKADVQFDKVDVPEEVAQGWKESVPELRQPAGGQIFYAAALCNRKYKEEKSKSGGCISSSTGMPLPPELCGGRGRATKQ